MLKTKVSNQFVFSDDLHLPFSHVGVHAFSKQKLYFYDKGILNSIVRTKVFNYCVSEIFAQESLVITINGRVCLAADFFAVC